MFIARSTIVPLAGCCPNLRDVEIDDCEQSTVTVRLALTKVVRPDQHRLSRTIPDRYENARASNQARTGRWRFDAVCCLRGRIETPLAAKPQRAASKDSPVCGGIRIPSAVLSQGPVRHLRPMAPKPPFVISHSNSDTTTRW